MEGIDPLLSSSHLQLIITHGSSFHSSQEHRPNDDRARRAASSKRQEKRRQQGQCGEEKAKRQQGSAQKAVRSAKRGGVTTIPRVMKGSVWKELQQVNSSFVIEGSRMHHALRSVQTKCSHARSSVRAS